MSVSERIYEEVKNVPEPLQAEALDFAHYTNCQIFCPFGRTMQKIMKAHCDGRFDVILAKAGILSRAGILPVAPEPAGTPALPPDRSPG